MNVSSQRGCPVFGLVMAVAGLVFLPPRPLVAQTPSVSREELMRKWDLNRDGKVDPDEAEISRAKMRRARNEALMNSGTDPLTGRPRVATDPVTGQPVSPAATDGDTGLILVPGTGENAGSRGGTLVSPAPTKRKPEREGEALPGTRAPASAAATPPVTPRLPAMAPQQGLRQPGMPAGPATTTTPRTGMQRSATDRPGVRPGYGSGGLAPDLNAGRLPGGLPQTRGMTMPPGAGGGSRIGPAGSGQPATRTGMGSLRGPALPPPPATGMPATARSGLRPQVPQQVPNMGRLPPPTPNTVPRPPRMSPDEFYGR